jgi:Uma2 family endonuclease
MAEPAIRHMTLAEFLRWEDGTDTRYELIGGLTMAMAPPAQKHDRQVKVPAYRDIGSINEILLIDSESIYAEIFRREGGRWITELVQPRDVTLRLSSVDLQIAMAELDDGIDIEAENAA